MFKFKLSLFLLLTISLSALGLSASETSSDIYPYRHNIKKNHNMKILNSGIGSLWARIDLIRRAEKTLELEYFIFGTDGSSRIIMRELMKAAKRGVKVRLLVDKSLAVFVLDEYYAEVLKNNNVNIRYYNTAPLILISTIQFRNHRKMISRDGIEAITGGRNIGDEYFDFSETFNFLDRDIWVEGLIVKTMVDSYDKYWDSAIVKEPKAPRRPVRFVGSSVVNRHNQRLRRVQHKERVLRHKEKKALALSILTPTEKENKFLNYAESYGKKVMDSTPKRVCPHVSFATDREGARFIKRLRSRNYHKNFRLLRKEIQKWMQLVDEEITLDSPYFLNNSRSRKAIEQLLNAGTKVNILTNSLGSTDAIYISTVFSETVRNYTPLDLFSSYIYSGFFSGETELISDEVKNAIWGTHSKSIVFNDDAIMVGTFNIDNRSSFYNTEMALFCQDSKALRDDVMDNIEFRMKSSKKLGKNGFPEDGSKLLANTSTTKKLLYFFLKIPAILLQFLL